MLTYSALGTKMYADSRELERVQSVVIDHGANRLRLRLVYDDGSMTQSRLRSLENGHTVVLALIIPHGPTLRWAGTLRFCRTRIRCGAPARTTVEFSLQQIACESAADPQPVASAEEVAPFLASLQRTFPSAKAAEPATQPVLTNAIAGDSLRRGVK